MKPGKLEEENIADLYHHSHSDSTISTSAPSVTAGLPRIPRISTHLRPLLALAVPSTITFLTFTLQGMIALYFVGMLKSTVYLSAYSLAAVWVGIFGGSIVYGLASGLDTLISQSFGRGDLYMCGVHLYRGMIVVGTAVIPCCGMMCMAGPAFRLLGIDPQVAEHAHNCAMAFIPGVLLDAILILLVKFMMGQRIARPQMVVQAITTMLYPGLCYLFMFVLDMGYVGVICAKIATTMLFLVSILVYMYRSGSCMASLVSMTSPNIWKDVHSGLRQYLSQSLPTMAMLCLDSWSMASMSIVCARIGVVDMAANSVATGIGSALFVGCMGISSATGVLVGNSVGEKNVANGKFFVKAGIVLNIVIILALAVPIYTFRLTITAWFTPDRRVARQMDVLMPLMLLKLAIKGLTNTLGQTLIGLGKTAWASLINFISYYLLMIPLGIILGSTLNLGANGLWLAMIVAAMVDGIGFACVVRRLDWEELSRLAETRAREGSADVVAYEAQRSRVTEDVPAGLGGASDVQMQISAK